MEQTPINKFVEWYNDLKGIYMQSEVQDKLKDLLHYEKQYIEDAAKKAIEEDFDTLTDITRDNLENLEIHKWWDYGDFQEIRDKDAVAYSIVESIKKHFTHIYGKVDSNFNAKKVAEDMLEEFRVLFWGKGSMPAKKKGVDAAKIALKYSLFTKCEQDLF